MRRTTIAITALALALAALPAASASGDYYSAIEKYDQLRQDIKQCNLDTNWGQLSNEARADCDPLFARYVLYVPPDDASILWIHCRSASNCGIDRPDGVPDPNSPIPDGSRVFDVKPRATTARQSRAKAARHHHRRHR